MVRFKLEVLIEINFVTISDKMKFRGSDLRFMRYEPKLVFLKGAKGFLFLDFIDYRIFSSF